MRRALLILSATALLAACSMQMPGFLRGQPQPVPERTQTGLAVEPDGTVLVPALRSAEVERALRGAILRVEGVTPTQGYHGGILRLVDVGEDGYLTYEFRARAPLGTEAVGPEQTRILTAGIFLDTRRLRDVRGFRVVAGSGTVTLPLR